MGISLRICSLLPSATEIVFALGLGDRLVAVTHECDYPPAATSIPVITRSTLDHGTHHSREIHHHIASSLHAGSSIYALDHALLERLDPTLILTQELCDVCAVSYDVVQQAVHRLQGKRTILSLEPTSLGGILHTIQLVGDAADMSEAAGTLVCELQQRIDRIAAAAKTARGQPRGFGMEWLDPPFTARHWVPEMIRLAGGHHALALAEPPAAPGPRGPAARYNPPGPVF